MAKQKNKDVSTCIVCGELYCVKCSDHDHKDVFCSDKCFKICAKEQESVNVEPEYPSDEEMNNNPF